MKQLNARKCSAEKNRIGSQRPPSPSSIHSGYSLYSTDTDDPVMSTHRGLDRCAALLANMMQNEEIEDVPTKLERGVGSKMRGVSHANQQKQTSKQRGPVTKTKVKTSTTQNGPVQTGTTKDKKQTGRRSFNQKLVSSTPNQKHTKLNKGEKKKQGGHKKNSKDAKRDRTEFHREKDVKDHLDPRIPARVSPGNKENQPLSTQQPQRGNVQHQFIETYDVTPQVLNENVVSRTRVKPEVIKNPALRQHHVQTERHVAARLNEKPHRNAASSKLSSAMQRLNEQQTYVGERDHALLQLQSVDVSRKARLVKTLPQDSVVQPGNMIGVENYSDPYTQPWVSQVDLDPGRITPENQHSRGGRNAYHQQHQHYDHHQQQQEQLDYQTSENRGYTAESHLAASSREGSRSAPWSQPSRNLDSHLQSGLREGPASGSMGPVQTTQSILRDLVGKLQKMNESQIQAPQAQHLHPSPGSGITPQDIRHAQLQIGHGTKNASSRGVEFDVREQGGKQKTTLLEKNLPKHSEFHHTTGLRENETGLGASVVGNQNMDLCSGDEQLEPVRDSARSCDQQSTNQSPGSVITQMQRMSHEDAGMDNENSGNRKPQSSLGGQKTKDDVGVQTPPLTSRPPTVTTSTKGSNALWDQVRALRYITGELHSANRKKADVQTEELLTELEEVIETLPFTSLDRDLQTEISLALQPIRSENSQLRRRLRIANQQLRQIQLQAQAKEINQSGVSLEVLTLQSLNVNLQKQVEELQSEKERQTRETADLRASLDELNADKHNMQDVFKKMDSDIKEKRKSWTLETSTLRQEITKLKSQLESERLRLESVEKEKEILRLSVKQRDSEIKRLQQMTRSMQEIISSVVPEKSLQSSLPDESKESRLENWLENHQSAIDTPNSLNRSDMLGRHRQTAWGQGQRSPDDTVSSSSPSSTRRGHSISPLHRTDWERMLSYRHGSVKGRHTISGGREKHKHTEDMLDADGGCDDLDSTLIEDTLDGDGTAYMSFADPQIGNRKPYLFHTSHKLSSGAGGTPSWVEKELSPATMSQRQHLEGHKNAHVSDKLGRTANGVHEVSSYGRTDSELRRSGELGRVCHGRTDSELRRKGEPGRVSERDLGRIFNTTEVGSVVSESTISSIASQYEAQFQVGLSKLDEDIARLQENLKGIVKR